MNIYPYVYRLDHPVTGEFYIGCRIVNKVPSEQDLGFYYFTSSKVIKPRFHEFKITIIAECFDKEYTYNLEQKIIEENWGNSLLINKAKNNSKGGLTFSNNGHSLETRRKLSFFKTGKIAVKDKFNNCLLVNKDDPRFTSGELVGINKDKAGLWNHINSKRIICEICGMICTLGNYTRDHGARCGQGTNLETRKRMSESAKNEQKYYCEICNRTIGARNWQRHLVSKKHADNL